MEITVANGTFRLKGRELYATQGIARRKVRNKKDAAEKAGWSYSTSLQWIEKSDELTGVNFDNLATFFFDVLEMKPEDVLEMRVGDIFKYIPKEDATE